MVIRSVLAVLAVLASGVALLGGCGSKGGGSGSTTTGPRADPPAEVLAAELVYFDRDGQDDRRSDPPLGRITDAAQLEAFARRYVDGDPPLPPAADLLQAGDRVLIGGVVSSGCFSADGALLVLVVGDVRLVPTGLDDVDPDVECVRVVNSVALVSVRTADLPAGATVQGT